MSGTDVSTYLLVLPRDYSLMQDHGHSRLVRSDGLHVFRLSADYTCRAVPRADVAGNGPPPKREKR